MFDIKSKIATLKYSGKFSENKNKDIINSIKKQIDSIGKDKINGVFISFRHLVYSYPKELAIFIKQLKSHEICDTMIGIYDYDMQTYKILRAIIKNTNIKLFHNIDTIKLFLDPKSFKKALPVLIFDDDKENTKTLTNALSALGYSVTKADSKEEYEKLLRSGKYKFGVTQSFINGSLKTKTSDKPTLFLSKKLILNLPIFMDTAVEILVTYTGLKAQKISHKITIFNNDLQSDVVCALMKFKGDLSGSFILIFPKETAIKALEAMLAETINPKDSEAIMDGVGEFCNSITGSAKTYLSQKNIKVLFELPRTYSSLAQLYTALNNNNGIWINMQLDQKPFYMFIVG